MAGPAPVIEHPNRRKRSSKVTKALVVALLLVPAALILIVTIGGWDELEGAKALQIAYVVMAFLVARLNRGVCRSPPRSRSSCSSSPRSPGRSGSSATRRALRSPRSTRASSGS